MHHIYLAVNNKPHFCGVVVRRVSSSYNQGVKVSKLHSWQVDTAQASEIQKRLAAQVSRSSELIAPRFIAGVDISGERAQGVATGAVVVLRYPELKPVETEVVTGKLDFPYIPGFLSFRESPLILSICEKLSVTPDILMVDGQGIAHPRRFRLASHLGLLLNLPTIGCAKSLLCGIHETPGAEPGSYAEVIDEGETIGAALRTKI